MSPESKQLLIRNKDSELFIGPLPHPEVLREYNELVPTSAERILSMVEQDARNEIAREKRAQVFAFAAGEQLAPKFHDHALSGPWKGFRDCHIRPDWVLVYRIDGGALELVLTRTGTHSELFAK
jgi:YafQ family addiction module toxin component